jgi:hypothetical protein
MKTTSHLACDFRQNKITFLDVLFSRGNALAFVLVRHKLTTDLTNYTYIHLKKIKK